MCPLIQTWLKSSSFFYKDDLDHTLLMVSSAVRDTFTLTQCIMGSYTAVVLMLDRLKSLSFINLFTHYTDRDRIPREATRGARMIHMNHCVKAAAGCLSKSVGGATVKSFSRPPSERHTLKSSSKLSVNYLVWNRSLFWWTCSIFMLNVFRSVKMIHFPWHTWPSLREH